MLNHACIKCKYYYTTLCNESTASRYNALMDAIMPITVEMLKPCCGFNPGGVVLDPEAPQCKDYGEPVQ